MKEKGALMRDVSVGHESVQKHALTRGICKERQSEKDAGTHLDGGELEANVTSVGCVEQRFDAWEMIR